MKKTVRGMTLLEVLIALAIFATAAISIIRAVSQHINTLSYLEEKAFASMVVDNQMAKLMLDSAKPKAKKGKEKLAGREWYWSIQPVETADNLLSAVDVSVATDAKASPILTVRSYVDK